MTPYKALINLGESVGFLHSSKRQHSTIEDALETPQRNELQRVFADTLQAQYGSVNPSRLLRGVERTTLTQDQLLPLVSNSTPSAADEVDYEKLLLLLLFFSGMGQSLAFDDYPNDITAAERIQAQNAGREWTAARINALLGISNNAQPSGIGDPSIPHGIDQTTYKRIAAMLLSAIREAGDGATLQQISDVYQGMIENEVTNRSNYLADDNASTTLSAGQFVTIGTLDQVPIAKTWLRTRSKNPRDIHLDQVGVTVPFNSLFPSRDSWSQELENCKCGIKVTYASGRQQRFGMGRE